MTIYYNTFFPIYYLSLLKNLLTFYTECLFIHKSALIKTVKFIEIQENGVRYTCTCLSGPSSGIPFSLSRRDGRKAGVTRVNSCAHDACGSYSYLYIERERRERIHTKPCHPSSLPSPRSFLAWAHLKRGPTLVSRQRQAATPQLHNRRPRSRVHLTSQIHNSLTLCRAKRPASR